ncbi:hypothetical protein AC1031_000208 [Aphanomyces cochlioides]|nr:hypothetical protein AC1031_000208 [Aphanomyces cochlioides]
MSLLDWNRVQQRSSTTSSGVDRLSSFTPGTTSRSSNAIPRPSRRRSVETGPISSLKHAQSTQLPRHSLQADDLISRPSEAGEMQDPTRGQYNIIWNNSFLGIVFRCNSKNMAVIRRIEANAAPQVLANAQVGDVLVAYNGEPSLSYDKTMEHLRYPEFPVTLTFAPPRSLLRASFNHSENNRPQPSAPSVVSTDMNESIMSYDDPDNLYHTTYEVVWNEGFKLGVSIVKVGSIPVVKERTCETADPALAQIQANDQLISIQHNSTASLGYQASIVLLRDSKKPVHLVFRRKTAVSKEPQPSSTKRESDYSIVWESGPLGLTLKKDKELNTLVVARLNGDGLASRCNLISLGDRLVSVSNVTVNDLGLRGTMDFLKAVPKPAMLVFHRTDVGEPETEPSSISDESSSLSEVAKPTLTEAMHSMELEDEVAPLQLQQPLPAQVSRAASSNFSDLDDSGLYDTTFQTPPLSMTTGPPVIEIVWTTGPLGMTLKQVGTAVVISRLTGKGESPGLHDLQPGDVLVGVNEMDTSRLDLDVLSTLLKSLAKPVLLRFMLQKTEEDL